MRTLFIAATSSLLSLSSHASQAKIQPTLPQLCSFFQNFYMKPNDSSPAILYTNTKTDSKGKQNPIRLEVNDVKCLKENSDIHSDPTSTEIKQVNFLVRLYSTDLNSFLQKHLSVEGFFGSFFDDNDQSDKIFVSWNIRNRFQAGIDGKIENDLDPGFLTSLTLGLTRLIQDPPTSKTYYFDESNALIEEIIYDDDIDQNPSCKYEGRKVPCVKTQLRRHIRKDDVSRIYVSETVEFIKHGEQGGTRQLLKHEGQSFRNRLDFSSRLEDVIDTSVSN